MKRQNAGEGSATRSSMLDVLSGYRLRAGKERSEGGFALNMHVWYSILFKRHARDLVCALIPLLRNGILRSLLWNSADL